MVREKRNEFKRGGRELTFIVVAEEIIGGDGKVFNAEKALSLSFEFVTDGNEREGCGAEAARNQAF